MTLPKSLIYSDVHLDDNSADTVLNEVLPGVLRLALEHGCKRIIFVGDFWHVRHRVPVRLLNAVLEHLRAVEMAGLDVAMLPGNHDQIDAAGSNALEIFNGMHGTMVWSNPVVGNGVAWMPYRRDPVPSLRELSKHATPDTILFLHYGVRGAMMNNTMEDTDGVEPHLFDELKFEQVICGHYHKRQTLHGGKITYVGSPYQTRADEAGQEKGVHILEAGKLTFLPQKWGKRFVRWECRSIEELKAAMKGLDPRTDVRVTLAPDVDLKAAHKVFDKANHGTFTITPQVKDFTQRLDVASDAGLHQYAQAYLDTVEADAVKRPALWTVFREITEATDSATGGGRL